MINLKIMAPDHGVCYNEPVQYVDVNTIDGHIGLQQNITPMIAVLKNSNCKIKTLNNETIEIVLCGGTLIVDRNEGIKIFTKAFATLSDLDANSIQNTINQIQDKIKVIDEQHKDYVELNDELNIQKDLLEALNTK